MDLPHEKRQQAYGSVAPPGNPIDRCGRLSRYSAGAAYDPAVSAGPERRRRRFRLPPWLRWGVGLAAVAFAVEYLVLPQIAGARNALTVLGDVRPAYLVIGTVLEILSVVAYAALTRSVLPAEGRPSLFTLLRIDTTTLGVSHIVPGGAATASALRFRLLHAAGVSGPDAAFAAAVQGVGSAIVLNVVLWIGLVISIPLRGFNPLYTAAAAAGALLLAGGVAAVLLLTRGQESSVRVVRAVVRRVPMISEDTGEQFVRTAAARLVELSRDRAVLVEAVLWATLNWLLDAAALWVFISAYGFQLGLDGLIVSFGLANVVAALPLTPGGLGLVEGVLVPTIVGFGAPRGIAVLGVVSYRLVNFWLPIPAAGIAYVSLRGSSARLPRKWRALVRW
jgi:uncharacterized protein (TIRG00374 family)